MKKSFRILALVMALMTALGAASFASADMPTNYVGVTTVEDTDFFYQGPGTNYDFVKGKNQVTAGTQVAIYSITDDGKWCYIGFSLYMGFIQTSSLNDLVTLRNGTTASIKATLSGEVRQRVPLRQQFQGKVDASGGQGQQRFFRQRDSRS